MAIRTRNKVNATFSMSSMTDLVFLLLIFFMITSTLVTTNAIKVDLPEAGTQRPKAQSIGVNIMADLSYRVNREPVAETGLEAAIRQAMAASPEASIVLHADRSVPLDHAVRVLEIAYRNKYKVVLATAPK